MSALQGSRSRLDQILAALVCIASIVSVVTADWSAWRTPAVTGPDSRDSAGLGAVVDIRGFATQGDPTATVVMLEFSDFYCSFCSVFARDTLPRLEREYVRTKKVLFAFAAINQDLRGESAVEMTAAASCLARQDQFWAVHSALFRGPRMRASEEEKLITAGRLDRMTYEACLKELRAPGALEAAVQSSQARARVLGVSGTPTFLVGINRRDGSFTETARLHGSRPYEDYRRVLAGQLDDVATAVPRR